MLPRLFRSAPATIGTFFPCVGATFAFNRARLFTALTQGAEDARAEGDFLPRGSVVMKRNSQTMQGDKVPAKKLAKKPPGPGQGKGPRPKRKDAVSKLLNLSDTTGYMEMTVRAVVRLKDDPDACLRQCKKPEAERVLPLKKAGGDDGSRCAEAGHCTCRLDYDKLGIKLATEKTKVWQVERGQGLQRCRVGPGRAEPHSAGNSAPQPSRRARGACSPARRSNPQTISPP